MIRKITIGLFVTGMLLAYSCRKYYRTPNDISGNNYIAGIVFLYNDYSANGVYTPLTNLKIGILDASDTASPPNYLYSVNSDINGHFLFTNLRNNVPYAIFAQDTSMGILFSGTVSARLLNDSMPITDDTLILRLDTLHQNGFIYTVTDSANNIVANCHVCVFSSPIFYQQDSCSAGAIFQLTTNTFGMASQFNVLPATYMSLAIGPAPVTGNDSPLVVPATNIIRKTIVVGRH